MIIGQNMKVILIMISKYFILIFLLTRKNGFGVLYLTNGEKYVGSFKDDFLHGYGAFTKQDG
jgi:hypothetical protein